MGMRWDDARKKILTDNFLTSDWERLAYLCDASQSKVIKMAGRLGLKRGYGEYHEWTDEEEQYLRDNYQTTRAAQLAKHLGFDVLKVRMKLWKLGLRKTTGKQLKQAA